MTQRPRTRDPSLRVLLVACLFGCSTGAGTGPTERGTPVSAEAGTLSIGGAASTGGALAGSSNARVGGGGAAGVAGSGVAGAFNAAGGSAPIESGGQSGALGTALGGSAGSTPGAGGATSCGTGTVGGNIGDLMADFALKDQNGKDVRLSDFCGSVVFVALEAGWCPYCMGEATLVPDLMAKYQSQGFMYLSIMAEDPQTGAPSRTFLQTWASTYGLTTPILADPGWTIRNRYPLLSPGTPNCMLVGRDGKIKEFTDDQTFACG